MTMKKIKAALVQKLAILNLIKQDHRCINKVTKPCLGFKSLQTALKTIAGIESSHNLLKGQLQRIFSAGRSRAQIVNELFGLTA